MTYHWAWRVFQPSHPVPPWRWPCCGHRPSAGRGNLGPSDLRRSPPCDGLLTGGGGINEWINEWIKTKWYDKIIIISIWISANTQQKTLITKHWKSHLKWKNCLTLVSQFLQIMFILPRWETTSQLRPFRVVVFVEKSCCPFHYGIE